MSFEVSDRFEHLVLIPVSQRLEPDLSRELILHKKVVPRLVGSLLEMEDILVHPKKGLQRWIVTWPARDHLLRVHSRAGLILDSRDTFYPHVLRIHDQCFPCRCSEVPGAEMPNLWRVFPWSWWVVRGTERSEVPGKAYIPAVLCGISE
jgi:hypothetical protein